MKIILTCLFVCCVASFVNLTNANIFNEQLVEGVFEGLSERQGRGMRWSNLNELWVCGADVKCWIDKGDKIVEQKKSTLLGEIWKMFSYN